MVLATILGGMSGTANALFGGGGGMLAVPALHFCFEKDEKRAHATSILVMLPLSIVSALIYSVRGVFDLKLGLNVTIGALAGGSIGARVLKKVPKEMLSLLFYGVMIYAGIRFLK